nr:protein kinase-like domain, phloem protein 2-like protein [Tanacetum cinerariifolium]
MSFPNYQFAHLQVPLEDILSATNNFDEENTIKKSEFAKEYKGQLLQSGELIDRLDHHRSVVEHQFWMEVIIYMRKNRGSLYKYLSDPMILTWVRRWKISMGIAQALSYIYYDESRDFSVIHQFICSATVVLNDDWEPKLYNFQFSMKIKASQRHHSFHTNRLVYASGYGDPTYIETKRVNHKSDMYSFGIILFELLCGRESVIDEQDNKYLALVATFHYKKKILDEMVDPVLWKQMDLQSFNVFREIAYDCRSEERSQRPNIHEVVTRLESALKLQMERQNEHSVVVAEVENTSSNHDEQLVSHNLITRADNNDLEEHTHHISLWIYRKVKHKVFP